MPECVQSFAPQHYQTSVRLMPNRVRASSLARPYIPGVEVRPFRHWENGICYSLLLRYAGARKTCRWKKKDAEREREASTVGNTRLVRAGKPPWLQGLQMDSYGHTSQTNHVCMHLPVFAGDYTCVEGAHMTTRSLTSPFSLADCDKR